MVTNLTLLGTPYQQALLHYERNRVLHPLVITMRQGCALDNDVVRSSRNIRQRKGIVFSHGLDRFGIQAFGLVQKYMDVTALVLRS